MKDFLEKILDKKKVEVDHLYQDFGVDTFLGEIARGGFSHFSFREALGHEGIRLIAEVKKASPSAGVIRADFRPVEVALGFEDMGAAAVSVLTERDYFLGSIDYLRAIKSKVTIPVLRKDFIVDVIQVYEARAAGADAILLIKAILSLEKCQELLDLAKKLGMDVLLEIHTEEELKEISTLSGVEIVGVNNRDLRTFKVDTGFAYRLLPLIRASMGDPPTPNGLRRTSGVLVVAESGYRHEDEIVALGEAGFDGVLIGEGMLLLE